MPKGNVNNHIGEVFGDWEVIDKADVRKLVCKCTTCGFIKNIDKFSLKNGSSLKCKHTSEDDYCIGKQYGEWKVISKGEKSGTLLCRCSCGNIRELYKARLLEGRTKSCGHSEFRVIKGTKYGKLTAMDDLGDRTWRYRCDCGRTAIFNTGTVRDGRNQCMECDKDDRDYLTGTQVGDWEVLNRYSNGYMCKCSCGTVRKVLAYQLRNKTSTSCGHNTTGLRDITGNIYGKLEVIRYVGKSKWECHCECGNICEVYSNSLRNNKTTSCGCDVREKILNTRYKKYGETCMYGKEDSKREKWQIDAVFNEESLEEYIKTLGYKPTSLDLANKLGINVSNILKKIHKYSLEDLVEIAPLQSNKEKELIEFINTIYDGDIAYGNRTEIAPYELDIYMPDKRLAIEFNGTYWHSAYMKNKTYHQDKTIKAIEKGIRLIHIFEYEWDNSREKIERLLKNIIQENRIRIGARETEVSIINWEIAKKFLTIYHLQGEAISSINLGCFYKSELVGVMTFGKPRFNTSHEYELIRLCWKEDITIVGGAEKMLNTFKKLYKPTSIITYCDVSKFTGEVYAKLGFKQLNTNKLLTAPNYTWVSHNGKESLTRYQTQKKKLIELKLGTYDETEDDIMYRLDYMKIYNSGNLKLAWRNIDDN